MKISQHYMHGIYETMPRKHIHKPGTAFRRNYAMDSLEAVIYEGISFGQAEERFGVPKATIWRKYRGMTSDKFGKPAALTPGYLNRKGAVVSCFKENVLGDEWCKNFALRNPELTHGNCGNMKRSKAQLSAEIIRNYFEVSKSLENVPPGNVMNYDETNISDDPGRVKVFVKKGAKHAVRIIDSSKSSNSVMFAVLGDGTMLPPYIVYKAKNMYSEWVENGPEGARYNRFPNGWFDCQIFEDWFSFVANDNKTICMENNIDFIFLPANSTHVCQPLDVAVFAPLKKGWRQLLTETGLIPVNSNKVLEKLISPSNQPATVTQVALEESFRQIMKDKINVNENIPVKRRKKIDVPAGKLVTLDDIGSGSSTQRLEQDNEIEDVEEESGAPTPWGQRGKRPHWEFPMGALPHWHLHSLS
ncbi:hypothetical protein NQ315_014087 [Exocentrus adspersus]|uniref:DDE-1 domain-containing protein n=1 Tax=Exocentrus adspersus TaxID=1586481 RepID=A0AAV8VVB2_9CUCU|nr:hypothetical protein NQ315_014087 [Exocentrus adspersus]